MTREHALEMTPEGYEFVGWCWSMGDHLPFFLADDGGDPPERENLRPVFAPKEQD